MEATEIEAAKPASDNVHPLVSICTVTYGRHPLLRLLEQCIANQDYPLHRVEWIILDDSPQRPSDLDFSHARETGVEVRYIPLPHTLKIGAKRNQSHEHCKGEIIIYMDDDDYYPPTRISHSVESLQNSPCAVAGCSELPLLLLPERSTWMSHAFGDNHATGNTLAFRREFLESHHYQDDATEAEESAFLDNFTVPMVQLEPLKTITCIGHSRNTVDKRKVITSNQGKGITRVNARRNQFAPETYLDEYIVALAQIESQHHHGIFSQLPNNSTKFSKTREDKNSVDLAKVAVITPYYKEDIAILHRCHESVRQQTVPCTHFLIADGNGHEAVDRLDCRHIRLGVGHADNGNTPRTIGALCAMNEGYTCIAYLDADNWYNPDHLELALATQQRTGCEVVFTGREIAFPHGELLPELDDEDTAQTHADTSSIVIFEPAFKSLALWAQMPKELGPHCDRVAFSYLTSHFDCAWSESCSVVFETWYWGHFLAAGFLPPANAKFLAARPAQEWEHVAKRFRQRSHTPSMPPALPKSPAKTRINLISILGPLGSGAHALQKDLCLHISFFGMPPNNFLYRWQQALGLDTDLRMQSEDILESLSRLDNDDDKIGDWRTVPLVHPEQVLAPGRSFTSLEAYFRVVQATMPDRCRGFSKINGFANIIERSSSGSYAAQLLFEMLPMHRALLVLSDPLKQIQAMGLLQTTQARGGRIEQLSLRTRCELYLDALINPLEAAPSEQLLLVQRESFLSDPELSLRRIGAWFGHETADWPDGLRNRIDTGGVVNQVYNEEMVHIEALVNAEIHLPSLHPQQQSTADLDLLIETLLTDDHAPQAQMEAVQQEEWHFTAELFAPLNELMGWPRVPPPEAIAKAGSVATQHETDTLQPRVQHLCQLLQKRLTEPTGHLCNAEPADATSLEPSTQTPPGKGIC